jgi:hypothetical protein
MPTFIGWSSELITIGLFLFSLSDRISTRPTERDRSRDRDFEARCRNETEAFACQPVLPVSAEIETEAIKSRQFETEATSRHSSPMPRPKQRHSSRGWSESGETDYRCVVNFFREKTKAMRRGGLATETPRPRSYLWTTLSCKLITSDVTLFGLLAAP